MSAKTTFYNAYVKMRPYLLTFGLCFTLGVLFFWKQIVVTVYSGELGVKYSRFFTGTNLEAPYPEGVHFLMPFDIMYVYDMRYIEYSKVLEIPSQEGMPIKVLVSCIYQLDPDLLPLFHQQVGPSYREKVLIPMITSVVRQVIGTYSAEELYSTARQALEDDMLIGAISTLGRLPITIHKFLVKSIEFPIGFTDAIVKKMVASQELREYQFLLLSEGEEAKRKFIEGLGIQKYQELVNSGMTQNFLNYEGIQATKELATSNNAKIVVVGGGDNGLPLILNTESDSSTSSQNFENALNDNLQNEQMRSFAPDEDGDIDVSNLGAGPVNQANPENPSNMNTPDPTGSNSPARSSYSNDPTTLEGQAHAKAQAEEKQLAHDLIYVLEEEPIEGQELAAKEPLTPVQEKWDEFVNSVSDVLTIQITPKQNQ